MWLNSTRQTLLCTGMPGAGKTVMVSIVVDHLQTSFATQSDIGIAYVYCSFERQEEQKTHHLLASLLKQLVQQRSKIPQCVEQLYDHSYRRKQHRPTTEDLMDALQTVVRSFTKTFLVLDALDECHLLQDKKFLKELFDLRDRTSTNLFVTSRRVVDIEDKVRQWTILDIRARAEDVTKFVDARMEELEDFVQDRPDLQENVRKSIIQAADGM